MTAVIDLLPIVETGRASSAGDLLAALLEESRELTAVERFAKLHDDTLVPAQSKHYRDLIPLSTPATGQQYAFEVDLDACSGCKACVAACHSLNGLEESETWRSVGLLHGQSGLPVIQHVTTACHHCVDPACLRGCPTNAYEKDPVTGVVRHLDDQCFGCQYCTMACPYEVPQYSPSKGIVRKCDMCHGRLAAGEAPACVQACPSGAIRISIVDVAGTVKRTGRDEFLPATPPATLTHPTTVFRTKRSLPDSLTAADAEHVAPQHAHLPLVAMLVLTQLSVGGLALAVIARWLNAGIGAELSIVASVIAGFAGLNAAALHLGRPHLAFRAVLGWRHSWLSREAVVFGVYAPLAMVAAGYVVAPLLAGWLPQAVNGLLAYFLVPWLRGVVEVAAIVIGVLGIYCSARIYQFTARSFWMGMRTLGKFAGTAVAAGLALLLLCQSAAGAGQGGWIAALLVIASVAKLTYEAAVFRHTRHGDHSLWLSSRLMTRELRMPTIARFALGLAGGVLLPALVLATPDVPMVASVVAALGFLSVTAGELLERVLYFSAVVPLRMPGGVKS